MVTNIKDFHPWHLVRYILSERAIPAADLDNRPIKGSGKQVYLVANGTKHAINSAAAFESKGLSWTSIWSVPDDVVAKLPDGDAIN